MEITLYTDGSSRGNPGKGGWGTIVFRGDKVEEFGGRDAMTTNNRMEITALIEGLKYVFTEVSEKKEAIKKVHVFADSEYVLKGISTWMKGWKKNGWKTSTKKPVLNQDLWQVVDDYVEQLQAVYGVSFIWNHVKGHSGHELNDRADEIATTFADNKPTSLYAGSKKAYAFKEE